MTSDLIAPLAGIVGDAHLSTRDADRLVYSVDASWLPQMSLDRGVATPRPDVIVYPGTADEVARRRGFARTHLSARVELPGTVRSRVRASNE